MVQSSRATDTYLRQLSTPESEERRSVKFALPTTEREITVRLADDNHGRNSARLLVNRMYSWRGYGDRHVIPSAPTHATFTASDDDQTVGTITLAIDSAAGLAADRIFRDEIDAFRRQPDAKVCELTKLAFDAEVPSKPLLASLFHIVFIYGQRRHRCTDLFIEVNPRHRRFYEAMLGFKAIGELKTNQSVGAPSQLMWLKVANIRQQIDHHASRSGIVGRSLYQFFFSPREEDGIYARLADEDQKRTLIDEPLTEDLGATMHERLAAASLSGTARSFRDIASRQAMS